MASKRLIARGEHNWKKTTESLDFFNIQYNVIDQDVIIANPDMLQGYALIIFENKYADADALNIVCQSSCPVIFTGELGFDSYAHFSSAPLYRKLLNNDIFFKTVPEMKINDFMISMDSEWQFGIVNRQINNTFAEERLMFSKSSLIRPDDDIEINEIKNIRNWIKIPLACWMENEKIKSMHRNVISRGWYKNTFTVPVKDLTGNKFLLYIGGVDDFDWVFINRQLTGSTCITWNQKWHPFRLYECQHVVSGKNEIHIRVQNINGTGGVWDGPVAVLPVAYGYAEFKKDNTCHFPAEMTPFTPDLKRYISNKTQVLAEINKKPIFLKQGNKYLFFGSNYLDLKNDFHKKIFEIILHKRG